MSPTRPSRKAPAAKRTSTKKGIKLAEALALRADHQRRISHLQERLLRTAKVQEGDRPPEDPAALILELNQTIGQLEQLIQRINRTNSATEIENGVSISDAIARRDMLKLRHGVYRDLATAAIVTQDRRTKSEIRFKSTVNIAKTQRTADELAKEHRELDARIQAANWQEELRD